jgi:hypothetical protein
MRGLDPRLHVALPLREGSWIADPGNDELTAQSYDTAAAKHHGILIWRN